MITAAARKGARVIVVYAPTKARVMLPLVVDELDASVVIRYLQLIGERLPPALDDVRDGDQLRTALERHEGAMESVVAQYFRDRGIAFISLTGALQASRTRRRADLLHLRPALDARRSPGGGRRNPSRAREPMNPLSLNRGGRHSLMSTSHRPAPTTRRSVT
ncbi:MAG: hypothetical protein M5U09_12280 [Gammaproteobacteria bacterium]|nr:hypothetical protein [Gammaproteobacteria bacterium]